MAIGKKTGGADFQPGKSGNPKGRPKKGETLTDALRERVDKKAIAEKLIELAMDKGDVYALKYIYDRVDGKPHESVTVDNIDNDYTLTLNIKDPKKPPSKKKPKVEHTSTDK